MKSLYFVIASVFILSSCQQGSVKTEKQQQKELDSFSQAKYGESTSEHVKKMTDSIMAAALFDTIGLYKSPVKMLSAKVVRKEYSSFRSVYLRYKNVSNKTISGVKFRWYGTNAFNEPADMGTSLTSGFGGGFTDETLKPGRADDGTWDVLSRDAKKIKLAWPIEVSFEDGTNWKLN